MKAQATTWIVAIVFSLPCVVSSPESLGQATDRDPLRIPDSDEGLPGAGPLRRSDWFRGVWRSRRGSPIAGPLVGSVVNSILQNFNKVLWVRFCPELLKCYVQKHNNNNNNNA